MLHELLSNEVWIAPQIDYLLHLQNLRAHLGPAFDYFFLGITKFGELYLPTIVISLIYWCIDTESGIYLFSLSSIGLWVSKLFKMIACVYRPWVLDSRVHPVKAAVGMSKGYSFPSGHTLMAATSWGGLAFILKKHKFICTLLIFLILLIAFSRNYVGVHTPQDVLFSLIFGIILIFSIDYLLKWCNKNKNRYLYLLPVINILGIATLLFFMYKSYPMDYVDGKLLVNPHSAIYVSVLYIGWILGILNGLFLSKRYFPYDAKKGSLKFKILSGIVGLLILCILCVFFENYLFSGVDRNYILALTIMFLIGFFITAIYPYILLKIRK